MSKGSNIKITVLFVLSVSLVAAAMTACLLTLYYRHVCFHILGGFCDSVIEHDRQKYIIKLWLYSIQYRDKGRGSYLDCRFLIFGRQHTVPFFFLVLAQEIGRPNPGADGIFGTNKYRRSRIGF